MCKAIFPALHMRRAGKELERRYLDMHRHLLTYFIDQAELDRDRIMTILDNLEAEDYIDQQLYA